jgi:hypothetical protein
MANNSNILRVFISSTFNDFRLERAVLQKFIFPKVKKEAYKKGISFLPIDLRWGVPEEAQIDHRTMDICLSEVERAKTEPHPDFIILSGDKYGWVPIPRVIEKKECHRGQPTIPLPYKKLPAGAKDFVKKVKEIFELTGFGRLSLAYYGKDKNKDSMLNQRNKAPFQTDLIHDYLMPYS